MVKMRGRKGKVPSSRRRELTEPVSLAWPVLSSAVTLRVGCMSRSLGVSGQFSVVRSELLTVTLSDEALCLRMSFSRTVGQCLWFILITVMRDLRT